MPKRRKPELVEKQGVDVKPLRSMRLAERSTRRLLLCALKGCLFTGHVGLSKGSIVARNSSGLQTSETLGLANTAKAKAGEAEKANHHSKSTQQA